MTSTAPPCPDAAGSGWSPLVWVGRVVALVMLDSSSCMHPRASSVSRRPAPGRQCASRMGHRMPLQRATDSAARRVECFGAREITPFHSRESNRVGSTKPPRTPSSLSAVTTVWSNLRNLRWPTSYHQEKSERSVFMNWRVHMPRQGSLSDPHDSAEGNTTRSPSYPVPRTSTLVFRLRRWQCSELRHSATQPARTGGGGADHPMSSDVMS